MLCEGLDVVCHLELELHLELSASLPWLGTEALDLYVRYMAETFQKKADSERCEIRQEWRP